VIYHHTHSILIFCYLVLSIYLPHILSTKWDARGRGSVGSKVVLLNLVLQLEIVLIGLIYFPSRMFVVLEE
jgi:hypothetical protein